MFQRVHEQRPKLSVMLSDIFSESDVSHALIRYEGKLVIVFVFANCIVVLFQSGDPTFALFSSDKAIRDALEQRLITYKWLESCACCGEICVTDRGFRALNKIWPVLYRRLQDA